MLIVRDVIVEIGGKTIVDGVTFQVRAGDKVGLVGRNGAGKTTLFKTLGGANPPKSGTIRREGATGYLSQDPRQEAIPEKLRIAIEEDPSDRNISRFSDAQEKFENDGGYAAESEVRKLVDGLGLRPDRLELNLGALSGGERRRLELARILFAGSDLLLLDEPTNHLDADARDWLLKFLRGYRGALLVISHDLDLLDEAITRVIHLDREAEDAIGEIVEYKGTYSQYLKSRRLDEERQAKVAEQQRSEIARLSTLADSMRGQTAKRARVAKNLDNRVARIEKNRVEGPAARRTLELRFPPPPPSGRTVVTATELWKSFGALDVFADVNFDVGRGERLLIMGLNGAGKTTLLKVLAGELAPDMGTVEFGLHVSVGY